MTSFQKKSVCFICYRKFPDTNFENYSHFVSENEYDVTVIANWESGQRRTEIIGNRKVYRIVLPKTKSIRRKWWVFSAWVIKFLRRNKFSIVHIHNTCPYFLSYKLFANYPSKYVYHNTSYPISTSRFGTYKRMVTDFLQALFMDSLIIQSEELKKKLIGIRNLKKTQVIPIGFNPRLFHYTNKDKKIAIRNKLHLQVDAKVLVYVGSMARFRMLNRLIEAFSLVCKTNKEAILLMVGDGDGLKDIVSLSGNLGIDKNVIFTGRVSHEQVVNFIKASDIGVSYVPINENYTYNPPLKTFEYLACGLPVIATRTVSNQMIIKERINGILVYDNAQDISETINKLLNDSENLAVLMQHARNSVESYDIETITKKHLLKLYHDLLD